LTLLWRAVIPLLILVRLDWSWPTVLVRLVRDDWMPLTVVVRLATEVVRPETAVPMLLTLVLMVLTLDWMEVIAVLEELMVEVSPELRELIAELTEANPLVTFLPRLEIEPESAVRLVWSAVTLVVRAVSALALAIPPLTVKEPMLEADKPLVAFVAVAPTRYTPLAAVAGSATLKAYTSRPPALTKVALPSAVVVVAPGARYQPVTVPALDDQTNMLADCPGRIRLGASTVT
jgi:hypothetical protein